MFIYALLFFDLISIYFRCGHKNAAIAGSTSMAAIILTKNINPITCLYRFPIKSDELLEKDFSDFQSDKIFNHTNLSNEIININKETNVLAYYIIKNELYKSLNVFLQFCKINNDDYIKIIDIEKYQLFLKKRKRDKGNDKSLKDINNHFLLETMRMSLNELKVI